MNAATDNKTKAPTAWIVTLQSGEQFLCSNRWLAEETCEARGGKGVEAIRDLSIPKMLLGQNLWRPRNADAWMCWHYVDEPFAREGDPYADRDEYDRAEQIAEAAYTPAPNSVPRLPIERSDFVEELAAELSEGTQLPHSFMRESLKPMLLAALPSDAPMLSHFPGLHKRQYVILLSETPGTGKGESWRRAQATIEKATSEQPWPALNALRFVDGDSAGSPEYAVVAFGGRKVERHESSGLVVSNPAAIIDAGACPIPSFERPRNIVCFDEGKRLVQKDSTKQGGSGLLTLYCKLFEKNEAATASFKNAAYSAKDTNVSMMLHFVREDFQGLFAPLGAANDGLLSRCTIVCDHKNTVKGDWRIVDSAKVQAIVAKLSECAKRKELPSTPGGNAARLAMVEEIRSWDAKRATRLEFLFTQDLYFRAIFSAAGIIDEKQVGRAAAWTRYQYQAREAYWPVDVGANKYESMEARILKALENGPLLKWKLIRAAGARAKGAGGEGVFTSALGSLLKTGSVEAVKVQGARGPAAEVFVLSEEGGAPIR